MIYGIPVFRAACMSGVFFSLFSLRQTRLGHGWRVYRFLGICASGVLVSIRTFRVSAFTTGTIVPSKQPCLANCFRSRSAGLGGLLKCRYHGINRVGYDLYPVTTQDTFGG